MSSAYIPVDLRHRLAAQARHRCGYCLSQEKITGAAMEIEHLFPRADVHRAGGEDRSEGAVSEDGATTANTRRGDNSTGVVGEGAGIRASMALGDASSAVGCPA